MYIHVKVHAGAKKESLEVIDATHYHISVKEKAERNMANNRICALLKTHFPDAEYIRIVSGHHFSSKLISISLPSDTSHNTISK